MSKPKSPFIPYYVAAAVRGPDNEFKHSDMLKSALTARIRASVYNIRDCGGEYEDSPISTRQVSKILTWLTEAWDDKASHHYINHLYDALCDRHVQQALGVRQCKRIIKHIETLAGNQ